MSGLTSIFSGDLFGEDVRVGYPLGINARTPAYALSSSFDPASREVSSNLRPLGSAPQTEFGARFPRILSDIDVLRGSVAPGVSDLREARLGRLADARTRAVGNLRENLQRRRVLGSSFASDALARTQAEFGRAEADADAQSFIDEFNLTQQALGIESAQLSDALNRELAELGLSADFAGRLTNAVSQGAAQQAAAEQAAAQARGGLVGSILGLGTAFALGGFGGGGSTGANLVSIPGGGQGFRVNPMTAGGGLRGDTYFNPGGYMVG